MRAKSEAPPPVAAEAGPPAEAAQIAELRAAIVTKTGELLALFDRMHDLMHDIRRI
jgi:hypothetical protein